MNEAKLSIEGMSCEHCVAAVDRALKSLSAVHVDRVEIGSARISYDPAQVDEATIRGAVEAQGFELRELEEEA